MKEVLCAAIATLCKKKNDIRELGEKGMIAPSIVEEMLQNIDGDIISVCETAAASGLLD